MHAAARLQDPSLALGTPVLPLLPTSTRDLLPDTAFDVAVEGEERAHLLINTWGY